MSAIIGVVFNGRGTNCVPIKCGANHGWVNREHGDIGNETSVSADEEEKNVPHFDGYREREIEIMLHPVNHSFVVVM